ncbi:MAG: hypothetical protein KDC18_00555 [Alphaproteobacteria bacterium]|nr:hypothetical protein [Alphaproteobacteria bacterium]MCB9929058.1 hypothetical protein [Alphaproteobacteria bacterium]
MKRKIRNVSGVIVICTIALGAVAVAMEESGSEHEKQVLMEQLEQEVLQGAGEAEDLRNDAEALQPTHTIFNGLYLNNFDKYGEGWALEAKVIDKVVADGRIFALATFIVKYYEKGLWNNKLNKNKSEIFVKVYKKENGIWVDIREIRNPPNLMGLTIGDDGCELRILQTDIVQRPAAIIDIDCIR